jgi:hypothetical protein
MQKLTFQQISNGLILYSKGWIVFIQRLFQNRLQLARVYLAQPCFFAASSKRPFTHRVLSALQMTLRNLL